MVRQRGWPHRLKWFVCGLLLLHAAGALGQGSDQAEQEFLRQQERERALRERQEARPDVRLPRPEEDRTARLPAAESPCFVIREIRLHGEDADRFRWALRAADPRDDPASGRCLGTAGISTVLKRVQNAIVSRGYVTTRVLAPPQDLTKGRLVLTVVPGRVRAVRAAQGSDPRASFWSAVPRRSKDLLNLRDIEQALENFERLPTVAADIQIAPADGEQASPGESDLLVDWRQAKLFRVNMSLDDSGSQATGKLQAGATLSVDHGLMWNDLFYVNIGDSVFNGSSGSATSWTTHYDVPLGYWSLGATAGGYDYRQTVSGATETYVYSGSSRNAEVRASRLLFRDATTKLGAYARGWWRESDNFIDDTEILVQRRRNAGWELGLNYKRFFGTATLDTGVAYRRGTGAFDALPAPEEEFAEGTSRMALVTADARFGVPFRLGRQSLRYLAVWRAQWNRTPLVPQDRLSIGGRYTVRGYDGEASLTGERGWLIRNDLGLALGASQEIYLGIDHGHVGGPSVRIQPNDRLTGAVIGMRGGWRSGYWDVHVGTPINSPKSFPAAYTTTGFNLSWSY